MTNNEREEGLDRFIEAVKNDPLVIRIKWFIMGMIVLLVLGGAILEGVISFV
jgi:hypothetical protein